MLPKEQMKNKISTFFVSQSEGDDALSGIARAKDGEGNGPFQTMERAISAVATLRAQGEQRPLKIQILGDYYFTSPIRIVGERLLTIEGAEGASRMIGGAKIEGWQRGQFNGVPCFCAKLAEGCPDHFTDLYVNGERACVTRYPTVESGQKLHIVDADDALRGAYKPGEHMTHTSKWFRFCPDDLSSLHNIEDAILHYEHYWIDEHSPIESYDRESGVMVMKYHSRFSAGLSYEENREASPLCYLTNIPDLFGEPAHWYLDRSSRTVYYIPSSETMSPSDIEAFAPISEKIFEVYACEDVYIKNLEMTACSGDYVSTKHYVPLDEGIDGFASDIQSLCGGPGAITFEKATRCGLCGCALHGVGVYAVEILQGSSHIRIEENHIYDISAGGIRIEGGSASLIENDGGLAVHDCILRKNHIHTIGKRYYAGCGILLMDGSFCEISENEIHDTEYSGISVGWVWGYAESATYACTITKNHIYDIGKGNLSDLGAIYLLGKQSGTVVSENVIHDVNCFCYGAWGIYLDEGSSFVRVEKNLVYRTKNECFHLHYGSHNTVTENTFYGNRGSCIRITREASDIRKCPL